MKEQWKIGQLAKRTGLTVRALRHYDQIGLLSPSQRTQGGYRLYGDADVARLQQILSLRQLGFSLEQVKDCLEGARLSPQQIVHMQLEQVHKYMELQRQLASRLEAIAKAMQARRDVSVEQFIQIIEVMHMVEKHGFDPGFSPQEMEKIKQQGDKYGSEKIREVEQEWPQLIAKVKAEMDAGTPPTHARVQKLAKRWKELVNMFSGGDQAIERKLAKAYQKAPDFGAQFGMTPELMEYVGKAMK